MLSAGRTVGQLSRITRHAHPKNYYFAQSIRHPDIVRIGSLRYASKGSKKNKTVGSTATVEECVPPKEKTYTKIPPLQPPPPPPIHAQPQTDIQPPPPRKTAPCDNENYTCPPNCVPRFEEACYKPGGPSGDEPSGFKYWKHLLAALILSGLGAYTYLEFFSKKKDKKKDCKDCTSRNVPQCPEESSKIPTEIPYLIVGGGTAAFSAFRSLKARDPCAKILMINAEGDIPYMRPPLSKELWYSRDDSTPEAEEKLMFRQWNGTKRSLFYEPREFFTRITEIQNCKKGGVAIATGWSVTKLDVINKIAYLEDGHEIKFDKCLIAVGGNPKNLEIFEKAEPKAKRKILPFRTKRDYLELMENLKNPCTKNIVVVGGGFLGSELSASIARNLQCKDQKVYQIYKEKFVMAQVLPEYLSEWTTKRSEAEGVICMPETAVHDCQLNEDRLELILSDGQILPADQVIVAVGVEVDKKLAKESDLEYDNELGGYLVNAELEARSNVWVAGDAACFYDIKLGRRRIEHHDHAVVSGRLVGENMTGARKPYLHQSMFWSDLGPEVGFEAIGIIDSKLETVGVFAKANKQEKAAVAGADAGGKVEAGDEKKEATSEQQSESLTVTQTSCKDEYKDLTAKSKSEEGLKTEGSEAVLKTDKDDPRFQEGMDDFTKGVVFYVRDKTVVGIVLWNIFNRMSIARQLLKRETTYDEINEAAKLFAIHED